MKVLISDDTPFMRRVLRKMVESTGNIVVAEADEQSDLVELYNEYKPNIVIMDTSTRNNTNIQALKTLRGIDDNLNIIASSPIGQQQYILDAIRAGATDFIMKPFNLERVCEILDKCSTGGYICRNS